MGAKRGESGLCFVMGVDKPSGMTSHDVVNRVRRIFGERRVGHTGTLDPLASGAMALCVGAATRLDAHMVLHDKTYQIRVTFGSATDTDDSEGEVIRRASVPEEAYDPQWAGVRTAFLIGKQSQVPPLYSAIKKNGVKAYEAARQGKDFDLPAREIEIYDAQFKSLQIEQGGLSWDLQLSVSKGTYIRSIARDLGESLGSAAHVSALRRISSGNLDITDCVTLEQLEQRGLSCALDPVYLLGYPMAFLTDDQQRAVLCGQKLSARALTFYQAPRRVDEADCGPRRGARPLCSDLQDGQMVSLVYGNTLQALYTYQQQRTGLVPACVFSQGVLRGQGV